MSDHPDSGFSAFDPDYSLASSFIGDRVYISGSYNTVTGNDSCIYNSHGCTVHGAGSILIDCTGLTINEDRVAYLSNHRITDPDLLAIALDVNVKAQDRAAVMRTQSR